ncbi:hypothetical protein H5410_007389 [Solanum commersonii]|uniref:Uncharacterized protein n=1 Tax=Solanum commersonii TaxID=4109 RepID=A0A9J6ACY0_SOLCO|nr:hypothetical protein H5410_007389 [Solanum commersonii]
MVSKVVESPLGLRFKSQRRPKTLGNLSICSNLGGHGYVVPVASGRWQVSRGTSRVSEASFF